MVKHQRLRQGIQRIIRRMGRIVPGAQGFGIARPACESNGQRVLAGVAVRSGIHAQKPGQLHIQPGFFTHFAHCGGFRAFALFNKTAGQGKAHGFVGAADDDHPAIRRIDNHIRRGRGIFVAGIRLAAMRADNLAFHAFSVWFAPLRATAAY